MKIIALWNNYKERSGKSVNEYDKAEAKGCGELYMPAQECLTDSCLLREGRPFYIPDWDEDFRLFPTLAIRIDRVGKSIPQRFAHRYYSSVSAWLNARACGLAKRLASAGLPLSSATTFDFSLVSAPFFTLEAGQSGTYSFEVQVNGNPVCKWSASNLLLGVDEAIEHISRNNTLKTGDIILLGLPSAGIKPKPGDEFRLVDANNPEKVLNRFKIK